MPRKGISKARFLLCLFFALSVPIVVPMGVLAQQSDIPPVDSQPGPGANGQSERVVEGRPAFYTVKKVANPLTWFEEGLRPVIRAIENIGMHENLAKDPSSPERMEKQAGIKLGLDSMGSRSGFGPEVKPFHKNLLGRGIEVELPLLITYRRYESYGFRGTFPLLGGESNHLLDAELSGAYRSRAQDNFFGIGNDTPLSDKTRFRSVSRAVAVALNSEFNDKWTVRAELGYENVGITQPRSFFGADESLSSQVKFNDDQAPGLFSGAEIISTTLSLERNSKDAKEVPSSGSLHHFDVSLNEARGKGDYSYWRYRYQLRQYFPLSADRRKVIAFRADVETNQEKGGSRIPFFDLPSIGGHRTVRGYESLRYTDKSALSLGLEYRYRIWQAFDWALFVDQGQVAPELGDLSLRQFHTGYGMRFIVRPGKDRAFSIDIGRSLESWRLHVVFNPTF